MACRFCIAEVIPALNPSPQPLSASADKTVAAQPSDQSGNLEPIANGPESEPQRADQKQEETENFDLLELRIKGNHLLRDVEIERTVYPFLGPQKTVETVENARSTLEKLYRTKGYQTVSVDVPEQDVVNGVIYLQVIEGRVSRLRVTESKYFSLGKIKANIPEVAEGKVPNFPIMQKQLQELSDKSPDRSITPVLRAGDTPGTMEIDLKVKDELPLHGKVELNGRNTSSTSRLRLVSSLHYDNLWQMLHSASLMYQVSPENADEVEVWAGTYAMPLPISDAKMALYAVSSSSNASVASAGALNVVGIGQIYGIRLIKPLPGFEKFTHNLTLGADYKDFKEDLNLLGQDSIKTPISYLPFLVQYDSNLFAKEWRASLSVGVNFAIRGISSDSNTLEKDQNGRTVWLDKDGNKLLNNGNNQPAGAVGVSVVGEFEQKRFQSRPNYAYLTLDGSFNHTLPYEMEFASRFSGQVSDSPLISNEQFALGGMNSVRGYFETQALSDDGVSGSLELRSPHLAPVSMDYMNKLQAIAFTDGGYGRVQHSLGSQPKSYSLASVGFGLRFQVWKYFEGILDLGIPLLDINSVKAGNPKLHFSIAAEF